jgi:hypothetical protein
MRWTQQFYRSQSVGISPARLRSVLFAGSENSRALEARRSEARQRMPCWRDLRCADQ